MSGVFDYASYIYLLAPVSLAIINPIGFVFMELQKQLSNRRLKMKQVRLGSTKEAYLIMSRLSGSL